MADLLWPGDERAGDVFSDDSVLRAMLEAEQAWLDALVAAGIAPAPRERTWLPDLAPPVSDLRSEDSGNPVVPMLAFVRQELADDPSVEWLHRGLTSQDVIDTALVQLARTVTNGVLDQLDRQVTALAGLVRRHRDDVMAGRTLTQHAVPITFGLKAASWLQGVLDARENLQSLGFPVQLGGAAGTLAAVVEIAGDPDAAQFLVADAARRLGLDNSVPWHTNRSVFTRYADALVGAADAMGHVANDVLVLTRPEIGEVAEPHAKGRGGSSTMPHKQNPVLSVLIRRTALAGPGLAAQLHLAASSMVDERADGAWHLEWSTLATLSRRTLVAASQTTELVEGLRVDTGRMAANAKQHADALLAERDSLSQLTAGRAALGRAASASERSVETSGASGQSRPHDPADYLGATSQIIDEILERAEQHP